MSKQNSTPVAPVAFPTVDDYRNADVSGKARIRRDVTTAMEAALRPGGAGLAFAQSAMTALDGYKAAGSAPKADTFDWNDATARMIADLTHAAFLLSSGAITVTGAPDGFVYEAPVGPTPSDMDRATRFATVPVRRSGKRDLRSYLITVWADIEPGTVVKVGDLSNRVAAIADDGYRPSPGAVTAALSGKKGIPGVTFIPANKAKGVHAAGMKK